MLNSVCGLTGSGVERSIGEAVVQLDVSPPAGNTEQKLCVRGEEHYSREELK